MTLQEITKKLKGSFLNPLATNHPIGDHNYYSEKYSNNMPRKAAVLIPLIDRPTGATILFTKRSKHLNVHPGQISFPGGQIELDDLSANDAALRETNEEIGLSETDVTIIGRLNQYFTRTGFSISPIVGILNENYKVTLNPKEVTQVFEVPLNFFLNVQNFRRDSYLENGIYREFYAISFKNHYIWGATAGMIKNLSDILIGDTN